MLYFFCIFWRTVDLSCPPKYDLIFIKKKVKAKSLYGSYSSKGEALDKINSTAVYALAAILGKKTGNKPPSAAAARATP